MGLASRPASLRCRSAAGGVRSDRVRNIGFRVLDQLDVNIWPGACTKWPGACTNRLTRPTRPVSATSLLSDGPASSGNGPRGRAGQYPRLASACNGRSNTQRCRRDRDQITSGSASRIADPEQVFLMLSNAEVRTGVRIIGFGIPDRSGIPDQIAGLKSLSN